MARGSKDRKTMGGPCARPRAARSRSEDPICSHKNSPLRQRREQGTQRDQDGSAPPAAADAGDSSTLRSQPNGSAIRAPPATRLQPSLARRAPPCQANPARRVAATRPGVPPTADGQLHCRVKAIPTRLPDAAIELAKVLEQEGPSETLAFLGERNGPVLRDGVCDPALLMQRLRSDSSRGPSTRSRHEG